MNNKKTMIISTIAVLALLLLIGFAKVNDNDFTPSGPSFASRIFDNGGPFESVEEAKEAFLKAESGATEVEEMIPAKLSYNGGPEGGAMVPGYNVIEGWVPSPYGSISIQNEKYGHRVRGYFISKEGNVYTISHPE